MKKHDYKTPLPVWKMKPQECEGKYTFDGKMYMTKRIFKKLTEEEIYQIRTDIRREVMKHDGVDYFFQFAHKNKLIFVIDNIDLNMKATYGKKFNAENNHFTIMFAEEY